MRAPSAYSLAMSTTVRRRTVLVVCGAHAGSRVGSVVPPVCAAASRSSSARGDPVQQAVGDLALRLQRQVLARPVGGQDRDAVRVRAEPGARPRRRRWRRGGRRPCGGASRRRARASRSRPRSRPGRGRGRSGSRVGAPSESRPRAIRPISASRSGVGSSSRVSAVAAGELADRRRLAGRKSATAAAITRASKPAAPSSSWVARRSAARSSAVDSTGTTVAPGGKGDLDVGGDDRHPRAAIEGGLGDRRAHLAGRAVADEAHRVDRLAGAAGGDDDVAAGEVGVAGRFDERWAGGRIRGTDRAIADGRHDGVDDGRQLGQAPDARLARRERPGVGLDDRCTRTSRSRPTFATVAGWVHMSPSIAGATTTGAEVARQRGGHDVAGQPVGHRAQPVRGRGRHDDRVGRVGDDDVADPPVGEQVEQRRSRPGAATAPRTTADRRSGWRTGSASPRRRRPRRAAGGAARRPCRRRSSRSRRAR